MPKKQPNGTEMPHIEITAMMTGNLVSPVARSELMMMTLRIRPGSWNTVMINKVEAKAITPASSVKSEIKTAPVPSGIEKVSKMVATSPILTLRMSWRLAKSSFIAPV